MATGPFYDRGGHQYTFDQSLTVGDVRKLCKELEESFGEGYRFCPELGVAEGGIEMEIWPGRNPGEYKSMRLRCAFDGWKIFAKFFPSPPKDDEIVFPSGYYQTFFKAHRGAPTWTDEELEKTVLCLKKIGFNQVGIQPKKRKTQFDEFFDMCGAMRPNLQSQSVIRHRKKMMRIYFEDRGFDYTFAYVDQKKGDIYSQAGEKSRGNIFTSPHHGLDCIDKYGVIVNAQKKKAKEDSLNQS